MSIKVQLLVFAGIAMLGLIVGVMFGTYLNSRSSSFQLTEQISNYPFSPSTLEPSRTNTLEQVVLPAVKTLDQVSFASSSADLYCSECVSIMVTGDVLTARSVNQKTVALNNFKWSFEPTADVLRSADITFVNLETPLIEDCRIKVDGMIFCGDPRNVEGLLHAGIDVVTFANNHAGNAGAEGVVRTEEILESAGIAVTGIHDSVVKEVKGTRFAFVGFNDVEKYGFVADVQPGRMEEDIASASAVADVVIVQFHWGEEYRYQPTQRQQELAHRAIDLGADLVVSNHPHWFEPVEFYNGKLIMYSHGNFVFDQMWSRETREGVVGKYVFQKDKLVGVEFLPVFIENYGQPRWMEGAEKQRILDILKRESEVLKNNTIQ